MFEICINVFTTKEVAIVLETFLSDVSNKQGYKVKIHTGVGVSTTVDKNDTISQSTI